MIDVDDYQVKAMKFRLPSANGTYALLNLAGEAGEALSLAAKFIRDGDQYPEDYRKSMKKELGDIMWMVSAVAKDHGLLMSDICQGNLDKLQSRQDRNVINGSGDER